VPQGSTTTARNQGAVSAPYRFDDYTALLFSHVRGALAPLSSLPTYMRLDVYPPIHWRADRASSAAGNHALQLAATDLEYEVTRVKSPVLGRDLNPMGRGDGTYYAQGAFAIYEAKAEFVGEITSGFGNSVCNGEAVPTALDLGGSPARSARVDAAGECCGNLPPRPPYGSSSIAEWCKWMLEAIEAIGKVFSGKAGLKELILHLCSGPKNEVIQCVCDALGEFGLGNLLDQIYEEYKFCVYYNCGGRAGRLGLDPSASACMMQCWLATIGLWILKNIVIPCMGKYLKTYACGALALWAESVEGAEEKVGTQSYSVAAFPSGADSLALYASTVDMGGPFAYTDIRGSRVVVPFLLRELRTYPMRDATRMNAQMKQYLCRRNFICM